MTNVKVTDLTAVTTVDDADAYYVARSGNPRQITGASLKTAVARQPEFNLVDDTDTLRGKLWWNADDTNIRLQYYESDGTTVKALVYLSGTTAALHGIDRVDIDIAGGTGSGHMELSGRSPSTGLPGGTQFILRSDPVNAAGGGVEFDFLYGGDDPTAGAGIEQPPGSLYSRTYDPGSGTTAELWFKTGLGNTDWVMVAP